MTHGNVFMTGVSYYCTSFYITVKKSNTMIFFYKHFKHKLVPEM